MGGLLSFLSPALTVATQAAGAREQGRADARKASEAKTLQLIALARQKALDEQNASLANAQIANFKSLAEERLRPPPEKWTGTVDYVGADNKPVRALRSESGKTQPLGAPPPAVMSPYQEGMLKVAQKRASGGAAIRLSDAERRSKALYDSAISANAILREQKNLGLGDKIASKIPIAGNYMMSPQYQRMAQAAYQLSEAWLRATSGAVINEDEIRRNALNYFPQPGDTDATVQQKARSRDRVVQSLREMAGRAADPNAAPSRDANPDLPFGGVDLELPPGIP